MESSKNLQQFLVFSRFIFESFLQQSSQQASSESLNSLFSHKQQYLSFVIGNEAADLDSCSGSIGYAYFKNAQLKLNHFYNSQNFVSAQNQKKMLFQLPPHIQNIYIPVMNCDQKDIKGRFELLKLAQMNNLDLSKLIFRDQVNFKSLVEGRGLQQQQQQLQQQNAQEQLLNSNFKIVLYDHHTLSSEQAFLKDYVEEIVDHHPNFKESNYKPGQLKFNDVRLIGSATSTITHYFMKAEDSQQKESEPVKKQDQCDNLNTDQKQQYCLEDTVKLDPDLALFFYGCILLDTENFNPKLKGQRWTDEDLQALQYLQKKFFNGNNDNNFNKGMIVEQNKLFEELVQTKFDQEMNLALGLESIMIKDFKDFEYCDKKIKFGYSAIYVSLESLLQRFGVEQTEKNIEEFMQSRKLDGLFLLHIFPAKNEEKKMDRVFCFFSKNNDILGKIGQTVPQNLSVKQLDFQFDKFKDNYLCYQDLTRTYTRKILEPLISKIQFQ